MTSYVATVTESLYHTDIMIILSNQMCNSIARIMIASEQALN